MKSIAVTESLFNEVWDYASGDKELNISNIKQSFATVAFDTAVNGTINYISNSAAASIGSIRTNSGWFVPKKFTSYFTKSFGQKMIAQTLVAGVIGTSLYTIYDKIDQAIKSVTEAIKQPPMFVN